jgi:mannitol/fructose-specific phosphotransferase system IIA component (Ntr-type)
MNLIFKTDQIIPKLKNATAFQVIGELVNHLVSIGKILPEAKEPISLAIKRRETSMSTGIGFGIAIPHADTDLINEVIVIFGRSVEGIDFDALDKQPVRLVVLVIVPTREKQKHLLTLASISRLLHNREIRVALQNARDADAILNILNDRRALAPILTPV